MRMGLGLGLTAAQSSGGSVDPEYMVTVPSGTVGSDLTDFVTPIHLQERCDFGVTIRGNPDATATLRETLVAHQAVLTIRVFLRGLHKRPVV